MGWCGTTKEQETQLTPKQERTIEALLTTRSIIQAAARADVSRRSISRWLREDEIFRRELKAARRDSLAQATTRLHQLCAGAVEVLHDILLDKKASSASRISGVRTALDFAYRAFELEDIEERLSAVESRLQEEPPAKPPVRRLCPGEAGAQCPAIGTRATRKSNCFGRTVLRTLRRHKASGRSPKGCFSE